MKNTLKLITFLLLFPLSIFAQVDISAYASSLSDSQKQELIQKYGDQIPKTETTTTSNPQLIRPNNSQSLLEKELNKIENEMPEKDQIEADAKIVPWMSKKERSHEKSKNELKQFGYNIFEQNLNKPFNITNIPVGEDYILGPDDNLIIRIWGKLEEKLEVTIDNNGFIYIPKVGNVTISGETFGNAKKIIKKELEQFYVNFDLSVTMGRLRTMKVFILGEVQQPGAYDVSSLSTLVMSLYVAGGPNKTGSLRNIILKRNNKIVKKVDLYEYLLNGDRFQDPKLHAFDTIFVPTIGDIIKIEGKAKRPGIFEMKSKTNAYDAIETFGGGFSPFSYTKNIQIERIINNEKVSLIDKENNNIANLNKSLKKLILKNGDTIKIFPILKTKHNFVSIEGHISRAGSYALKKNMTVEALIKKAENLQKGAYKEKIDLYRYISPENKKIISLNLTKESDLNFKLQEWDIVKIHSKSEVFGTETITIEGFTNKAGEYQLIEGASLKDALFWAGLKNNASLVNIEVYRSNDGSESIFSFTKEDIFENKKTFQLKNNDLIIINADIDSSKKSMIQLTGEIKYPGKYIAKKGESLNSIIQRAGGFTEKAFLKGVVFKRTSIKKHIDTGQKIILEEEQKRLVYDQSKIKNGTKVNRDSIEFLQSSIENNRGRLILDFDKTPSSFGNSILVENDDTLDIPQIPSSVQIIGGVINPGAILYAPNLNIVHYIEKSGGYSEFAVHNRIYSINANGSITLNPKKINRGDTLYIPEEIKYQWDWLKIVTDTSKILFNFAYVFSILN
ncbi:hypothetical protein HOG98_01855 [bacterium]|jgi:protein involved in polysaccharide export with SLBB domain|nr:hypothetical protein [bacterium]